MNDTENLRACWEANREMARQIAELHDVLVAEFGGHTDVEGACRGAIRVMRTQARVIQEQRREIVQLAAETNPTYSQRVAKARQETV